MTDKQAREDAQKVEGSKAGLELLKYQQTLAQQREIAQRNSDKGQTKKGN